MDSVASPSCSEWTICALRPPAQVKPLISPPPAAQLGWLAGGERFFVVVASPLVVRRWLLAPFVSAACLLRSLICCCCCCRRRVAVQLAITWSQFAFVVGPLLVPSPALVAPSALASLASIRRGKKILSRGQLAADNDYSCWWRPRAQLRPQPH